MNEKMLQISDMSLSERDMVQEKDNSIQNKSFYSTDLDVPDLVEKKDYFQLKIINDGFEFHINKKNFQFNIR